MVDIQVRKPRAHINAGDWICFYMPASAHCQPLTRVHLLVNIEFAWCLCQVGCRHTPQNSWVVLWMSALFLAVCVCSVMHHNHTVRRSRIRSQLYPSVLIPWPCFHDYLLFTIAKYYWLEILEAPKLIGPSAKHKASWALSRSTLPSMSPCIISNSTITCLHFSMWTNPDKRIQPHQGWLYMC